MNGEEFNNLQVNNEREGFASFEFGKIQNAEFSFKKENETKIKEEENASSNTNKDEKVEEVVEEEKDDEEEVVTKVEHPANSSTDVASSSAATGFIASASAVSVATVSTVIGINVLMNTKCEINKLDITPVSVTYDLDISDANNDVVTINLENKENEYLETQDLVEGNNVGSFEGLIPSCEYTLKVIDTKYDNIVYEEVVTTKDLNLDINLNYSLSNLVYGDDSVDIKLSYYGDVEYLTDVNLHLLDSSRKEKVYPLNKTTKKQKVRLNKEEDSIQFDLGNRRGFDYYLSYVFNEEEISLQKQHITFVLTDVPIPEPELEPEPVPQPQPEPDPEPEQIELITKVNHVRIEYVEEETQTLGVKIDVTDEKGIYSLPRLNVYRFVDNLHGGLESGFELVDTIPVSIKSKEVLTLIVPDINYTGDICKYELVANNSELDGDEILDSGVFYTANIEKHTFRTFNVSNNYFVVDNKAYLPITLQFHDYDNNGFPNLNFRYTIEGKDEQKSEIKKINGTQYVEIDVEEFSDEIKLSSCRLAIGNYSSTNNTIDDQLIANPLNDITLTKVEEPEIFGGYITSTIINKNDPKLELSLVHNDYETNLISNVKFHILDSYPPEECYETYNLDISGVDFINGKNIEVDLSNPIEEEKEYDYTSLLSLMKESQVTMFIEYEVSGESKITNLYPMIFMSVENN